MHVCEKCRFWSEMCAQAIGKGPMEALCLSENGPKKGKMVEESFSCPAWKSGHLGAVDDPARHEEYED